MTDFDDEIKIEDLKDPSTFSYFINQKWDYYEDRDPIACYLEYKDMLDKKEHKINFGGFTFLTLSPDHNQRNIKYCTENIEKLKQFCKAQFTDINYSYCKWVVESGKHADKPHLHIHAFCRIRNPRHHKRDLCCLWKKFFPALIGDDYHIVKCNTKEMFEDKQAYLENDRKGTHMNYEDLSQPPHCALGFSGVLTAK